MVLYQVHQKDHFGPKIAHFKTSHSAQKSIDTHNAAKYIQQATYY